MALFTMELSETSMAREASEVLGNLEKLVPGNTGVFGKVKNYFLGNRPKEVRIHNIGYWTASQFKAYKGEDPRLDELNHIWIAVKGTNTILSAELHYQGDFDRAFFRTEALDKFDREIQRELDEGDRPRLHQI